MKILLICSSGMSSSLLAKKIKKAADDKGIDAEVWAVSTDALDNNLPNADIVLLGPQIRFMQKKISEVASVYNVPVDVIDAKDYGMCNGANVLEKALKLLNRQ
ncbi:PTS sugar transporter subunit IIB [Thermoanaerobacterium thermosaccharolyticum]|uniref:Phosphotransferase system cellobiose-specific component IIB n=1 Tax=Thermoanaerobacterium thermosaccharolyticum M0795 TaxID=698948 RepID=L0IPQ5_THETR|nr:PTS sugar transporter subunit IIB [Thermoanaerobacterium thermosaccharolyticum]AGB19977.1 phosphotransferase system cellobiose-specific component IIB [Thermoanaerobacterium thermosaccharolyticum M0795]